MGKYDLSDNQWNAIKEEIAPKTSKCGRERRDPRELINAINWVGRTGAPWSEIPAEYGPWRTAYNNFRKWTEDGTIGRIFAKIAPKSEETEEIQLDGTYIRAHQHSAGVKKKFKIKKRPLGKRTETDGKIGRSRGGLTSKIHAITDGNGKSMKFIITSGTTNDSTKAIELLKNIVRKGIRVLADKGYDAAKILAYIQYCCAVACIPPRKNKTYPQKYNKKAYKNRNQIERFFQRLKNFRRVASRYDKLPSSFLSFVHIAAVSVIIPKFTKIV